MLNDEIWKLECCNDPVTVIWKTECCNDPVTVVQNIKIINQNITGNFRCVTPVTMTVKCSS